MKKIVGFADHVCDQTNLITYDPISTKQLVIIQSLTFVNKYFKFHIENKRGQFMLRLEIQVPVTIGSSELCKGPHQVKM